MSTKARLERLERKAGESIDWRDYLPAGVTVEQAERFMDVCARMAANYAAETGVSIERAIAAVWSRAAAVCESGHDEDDDDDEEL